MIRDIITRGFGHYGDGIGFIPRLGFGGAVTAPTTSDTAGDVLFSDYEYKRYRRLLAAAKTASRRRQVQLFALDVL